VNALRVFFTSIGSSSRRPRKSIRRNSGSPVPKPGSLSVCSTKKTGSAASRHVRSNAVTFSSNSGVLRSAHRASLRLKES
jgi:hypothetical protein